MLPWCADTAIYSLVGEIVALITEVLYKQGPSIGVLEDGCLW